MRNANKPADPPTLTCGEVTRRLTADRDLCPYCRRTATEPREKTLRLNRTGDTVLLDVYCGGCERAWTEEYEFARAAPAAAGGR